MKTRLTRKQTITEFDFNEHDDLAEDDEQGGLQFEIDKNLIGIQLTVPYSPERRAASSQRAKESRYCTNLNNFGAKSDGESILGV